MLSSQFGARPGTQAPPAQTSTSVQALLSVQLNVLFTCWQPSEESHESLVHGLPSSQEIVAPTVHTPATHTSPTVHTEPSLHSEVLLMCWQPRIASQFSVVHGLLSTQVVGVAEVQAPLAQVSPLVQLLLSLHAKVLLTCWQPSVASQESVVQGLPSSQLGAAPGTQDPPAHLSFIVHTLLSLQDRVLLT